METIAVTNKLNTSVNHIQESIRASDDHHNHQEYLTQLTPLQRKAHAIAVEHLATSFDITRSNGYNEWIAHHPSKSL